jgi:hypothetical protein
MRWTSARVIAMVGLSTCAGALGQPAGPRADEAAGPSAAAAAQPAPGTPPGVSSDAQTAAIQRMLAGTFYTRGDADEAALAWNAAVVRVEGLENAVYFEIARRDDLGNPFRSGILHVMRGSGETRLRVFDFSGTPTIKGAVTGLWLAPGAFPKMSVEDLRPQMDLVQRSAGEGSWSGATRAPVPTIRGGAVEMTSEISLGAGTITVADRGFDGAGKQVWGPGPGKSTTFSKGEPTAKAETLVSGLVVITLVPAGEGPRVEDGGSVVFHYHGYLADGTVFDTSRREGRQPFRMTVPANVPKGVNEGVLRMGAGERRRLVIPPQLAYGETGTRSGPIPPNATLYFDLECLMVEPPQEKAATEQPAPAQAPGAGGGGGGGAGPK